MSEFDVFAPFYDLEHDAYMDDLPLYEGYASGCGGAILELACGSGRLLAPLAQAGHRLVGVDVSTAMLHRAAERLAAAGLSERVQLLHDDVTSLTTLAPRRFRLAFCALNSFCHLPDQAAQLATLTAVHRHLEPGGLLILDLFHPHPDVLARHDGRLVHEAVLACAPDGSRIDKFVSRTLDAASQSIHVTFFYDQVSTDRRLIRTAAPFTLRYVHRYELELLLERTGFRALEWFGDHALAPFGSDSPQMIVVAQPR